MTLQKLGVLSVALLISATSWAATEFPINHVPGAPSIVEGAMLDVQPSKLSFTVAPKQAITRTIVIRNLGPEVAELKNKFVVGKHFSLSTECPIYFNTGDTCLIRVVFKAPAEPGTYRDTLKIGYDGTAPYLIRLIGEVN